MTLDNPLYVLGVPKAILAKAAITSNFSLVLKVAESNYKSLAKVFHPDRPQGDEKFMIELSQAWEELQDLDALTYYLDESVSESDLRASREVSRTEEVLGTTREKLAGLSICCNYVNQFEVLGITEPHTYITAYSDFLTVIEVQSEKSGSVSNFDDGVGVAGHQTLGKSSSVLRIKNNIWQYRELKSDSTAQPTGAVEFKFEKWRNLNRLSAFNNVRVVGWTKDYEESNHSATPRQALAAAMNVNKNLHWASIENALFLSYLESKPFPLALSDAEQVPTVRLVLFAEGKFALTNPVVAESPLKANE